MGPRAVLISVLLVEITSFYIADNESIFKNDDDVELHFRDFIAKYKKLYAVGSEEYFRRLGVFKSNLMLYAKLNSFRDHLDSAIYGVTKFSDLTQDEFKKKYLSRLKFTDDSSAAPSVASNSGHQLQSAKEIPKKFDWRTKGIITEPRDQMTCGGCWAFASVETIESVYAKKTKQLVPLSVQQMIDCSFKYSPSLSGCDGGSMCSAFDWAKQTKTAFVPEATYPYADGVQKCKTVNETRGPTVVSYSCDSFKGSESKMLEQIYSVGPLTVGVDASNWNNYQGGVIRFHCGEVPMNHAVEVVGYDLTGPIPFYIVKNSWGADWGIGGYLKVMYGDDVCSISESVSTVQVT